MLTLPRLLFVGFCFVCIASSAPVPCKSCSGNCKGNSAPSSNETTSLESAANVTDTIEAAPSNATSSPDVVRPRRHTYVEMRTCPGKFPLELFIIPLSIALIPVALISLLLCVCYCGPKDSRGHAPQKILGIRLSQKRHASTCSSCDGGKKSEDELDYREGYVQRKDSKKTRFATDITVIQPVRRASSVSCLETLAKAEAEKSRKKKTTFSESVTIVVSSEDRGRLHPSACLQRSISVT